MIAFPTHGVIAAGAKAAQVDSAKRMWYTLPRYPMGVYCHQMFEGPKTQVGCIPYVDVELCEACNRCAARVTCRSKAIVKLDPGEPPFVDASRCYGCQLCVAECPFGAVVAPTRSEVGV